MNQIGRPAAPLSPPPKALLRAFPRSNYQYLAWDRCPNWDQIHLHIISIDESFNKNSQEQHSRKRKYSINSYRPSTPRFGNIFNENLLSALFKFILCSTINHDLGWRELEQGLSLIGVALYRGDTRDGCCCWHESWEAVSASSRHYKAMIRKLHTVACHHVNLILSLIIIQIWSRLKNRGSLRWRFLNGRTQAKIFITQWEIACRNQNGAKKGEPMIGCCTEARLGVARQSLYAMWIRRSGWHM